MKTKSEMIAEIMRFNPTVGAAFLSEFNMKDLNSYLRRLRDLRENKIAPSFTPWATTETEAMATFQPA